MDTKEIFAQRLLEIREHKNITRQKAADDLGISRASLEYYEKGKRFPDINMINSIADYFSVSVDYLFGRTQCTTVKADIRNACDYLNTDIQTAYALKLLIDKNKEYGDEFKNILTSNSFLAMLYHIYLSFSLRRELGEVLLNELEEITEYMERDEEYLYNEFGGEKYSSRREKEAQNIQREIDLNEYRAQKNFLALLNTSSREYSVLEWNCYSDYLNEFVPTEKFFDEVITAINVGEEEINDKINDYIEQQTLMDMDD